MTNLIHDSKFIRVASSATAGTSTVTTDVVDMKGFDGCVFLALLGDIVDTSELTLTVQHGDEADGSDMADTTVTATYTADATDADDDVLAVEIFRPIKRYVRATLDRGIANATVGGVVAIQTDAKNRPTTHDDTVLDTGFGLSPASA
jgi:hypothetical protein